MALLTDRKKTKPKIMVVEDEVLIATDIADFLKSNDYLVHPMVTTGPDAIALAAKERPDLIIMDIVLEGPMDGIETAEKIRSSYDIPVVFLTAFADEEKLNRAKFALPHGYILKPFNHRDLLVTIEMALYTAGEEAKRKKAESALRLAEERLRIIFEESRDAIFITSSGSKFVEVNRAATIMTGYTKEELLDMSLPDLHNPVDLKAYQQYFNRVMSGEPTTIETKVVRKDGICLDTEFSNQRIIIDNSPYMHTVARDISHRRQAEKMEALGTLSAGIAHDFNNILGSIILNTEFVIQNLTPESQDGKVLRQVLQASHRARELVEQILAFSRHTRREKKTVQITPIFKETIRFLRSVLPATIEIRCHFNAQSYWLMMDPTEFHQALLNLCSNAAHAMRKNGGVLEIELLDHEFKTEARDLPKGLGPGRYLKITVKDTGEGMAPGIMQKIFDPFFTTKSPGEGTGLGLSVVHGIVTGSGGSITVNSVPDAGTVFTLYFPQSENQGPNEIEDRHEYPLGTEKILFIDDEKLLVYGSKHLLNRLGYKVEGVTDSLEALRVFQSHPERFDLIITDLTMPKIDGVSLCREILSLRPDIPIILCTGYDHNVAREQINDLGIKEILVKPVLWKDMADTVRRVLDQTAR